MWRTRKSGSSRAPRDRTSRSTTAPRGSSLTLPVTMRSVLFRARRVGPWDHGVGSRHFNCGRKATDFCRTSSGVLCSGALPRRALPDPFCRPRILGRVAITLLYSRYGSPDYSPTMRGLCREVSISTVTSGHGSRAIESNHQLFELALPPLVFSPRRHTPHYSLRRARMGSMLEARHAGIRFARPTAATPRITAA
jgi:hypothetical protein